MKAHRKNLHLARFYAPATQHSTWGVAAAWQFLFNWWWRCFLKILIESCWKLGYFFIWGIMSVWVFGKQTPRWNERCRACPGWKCLWRTEGSRRLEGEQGLGPQRGAARWLLELSWQSAVNWVPANKRNSFSHSSGGQNCDIEVLAAWVSSGGSEGGPVPYLSPSFRWLPAPLSIPWLVDPSLKCLPLCSHHFLLIVSSKGP